MAEEMTLVSKQKYEQLLKELEELKSGQISSKSTELHRSSKLPEKDHLSTSNNKLIDTELYVEKTFEQLFKPTTKKQKQHKLSINNKHQLSSINNQQRQIINRERSSGKRDIVKSAVKKQTGQGSINKPTKTRKNNKTRTRWINYVV